MLPNTAIDDLLDPRVYLERFIADNTCELCLETLEPLLLVYSDGEPVRYAPRVERIWMRGIFKRPGYKLKHWKWWRLCEPCRLVLTGDDDLYGFAKFVFPILRNMPETSLLDQIMQVQPLGVLLPGYCSWP